MTDPVSGKPYQTLSLHSYISEPVKYLEMSKLSGLDGNKPISITLTQGMGTELHLKAKQFDSSKIHSHDADSYKAMYVHPYQLDDCQDLGGTILEFVRKSVRPYIHAAFDKEDLISQKMFQQALLSVESKRVRLITF